MQVELSAETVRKAELLVESGEYGSVAEAIEAALEILPCAVCSTNEHDPLDFVADDDAELGRSRPADDAFFAEMRELVRMKANAARQRQ